MNSVPRPHTWIHRHSHTQHVPSFLPSLLWLLPAWWGPWPLSHYSIDWNHILSQGRQMLIDKQTPRHVPHMGVDVLVINYITLGQGLPVDDGFCLRSIYHQHCGKNTNTPQRREVCSSPECSLIGWSYSAQLCHYDLGSCAAAVEQYSHVCVLWLTPALWFNPMQIHTSLLHITV